MSQSGKAKPKSSALFWAIELPNDAFEHDQVKQHLDANQQLIKLKKIHSTRLFTAGKYNPDEEFLKPFEGKKCKVVVDGFGHSDKALALRVKNVHIVGEELEEEVPFFGVQPHITMALKDGIAPKYSVDTLTGSGEIVEFDSVLELYGTVKRY